MSLWFVCRFLNVVEEELVIKAERVEVGRVLKRVISLFRSDLVMVVVVDFDILAIPYCT